MDTEAKVVKPPSLPTNLGHAGINGSEVGRPI